MKENSIKKIVSVLLIVLPQSPVKLIMNAIVISVIADVKNKLMQYKLDKLRNIAEEMNIELNINNKKKTKKQLANDIIEHQSK